MGRRTLDTKIDPKEARLAVAKHLRSLSARSGVNFLQFYAQQYEEEMLDMLVGFSRDMTLTATLRRQCMLDVLLFARGAIKPWIHVGDTVDPAAPGAVANTVGEEIQAARLMTDIKTKLDEYVRAGIPPEQWPEDVREAAGTMLAYYTEEVTEDN